MFIAILETAVSVGIILGPIIGIVLYDIGGYTLPFVLFGFHRDHHSFVNQQKVLYKWNWNVTSFQRCWLFVFKQYRRTHKSRQSSEKCLHTGLKDSFFIFICKPTIISTTSILLLAKTYWAFQTTMLEPHLRQFGVSQSFKSNPITVQYLGQNVYVLILHFTKVWHLHWLDLLTV